MRFRPRFNTRWLFVGLTVFAVAIAWGAFVERRGRVQMQAISSLSELGIGAAEDRQLNGLQTIIVPKETGEILRVEVPTIRVLTPNENSLLRRLLGDSICARYSTVVIGQQPEKSLDAIIADLDKLPWLKSIYFNPYMEIHPTTIARLKSEFPDVEINAY